MSEKIEINVKVNGKEVPLSNISVETFNKIRGADAIAADVAAEKNAPVFSKTKGRLIVKMTPLVKKFFGDCVKNTPMNNYCSFEPDGFFGMKDLGNNWEAAKNFYGGEIAIPLFERN